MSNSGNQWQKVTTRLRKIGDTVVKEKKREIWLLTFHTVSTEGVGEAGAARVPP